MQNHHPLALGIDRRRVLGAMAASLPPLGARAQSDFPNRALETVVPQPPGGGFDFVGRTLADALQRTLGQSVVVENRPGSGTLVGTDDADDTRALLARHLQRWVPLVRAAGLRAD
jgi:tripartite-type tricarboxylate transporter receptor subunit TctC